MEKQKKANKTEKKTKCQELYWLSTNMDISTYITWQTLGYFSKYYKRNLGFVGTIKKLEFSLRLYTYRM